MNLTTVLRRAEARKKEIGYEMSKLDNEERLLTQIIEATQIPSEGVVESLMAQYRQLYRK